MFQSPIRRGSRCNQTLDDFIIDNLISFSPLFVGAVVAIGICSRRRLVNRKFQSPIRRGRRCNAGAVRPRPDFQAVSVPYLSGQALQSCYCGGWHSAFRVSVPYLSGQALQSMIVVLHDWPYGFQSPICRGRRCNDLWKRWRIISV